MRATIYTTCYEHNVRTTTETERDFHEDLNNQELEVVNLYPEVTFQEVTGFGGAITESVGVTLGKMPEDMAQNVIRAYFGQDGLGYTLIRSHIDSCDFSLSNYSAVEDEGDLEFNTFSISRDEEHIIPYIQAASQAAGKFVPVMLTPWSPPAFMKTNGSRNGGGRLKTECYAAWAAYLCRYITEYRRRGINVAMLSLQNEPNANQTWDSCLFSAQEEKVFLRDYLGPALQKDGLDNIGVYIWDHNKERMFDRALAIIDDETSPFIEGVAFHWYSGDHFDALRLVNQVFPDKKLLFSEGCIEYSRFDADNQLENAQLYAHDMIGNFNAGMNAFIDWNIALDQNGGPNHARNYCEAPIICDTERGILQKRLSFYYIEHFSRYIQPGAVRIATTQFTSKLEITAFRNPNQLLVLVMLNREQHPINSFVRLDDQLLPVSAPQNSISTVLIQPSR